MITQIPSSICLSQPPDGWAQQTLSQLSLDEKVGQLFMVAAVSDEELNSKPLSDAMDAGFMQTQPYKMAQTDVESYITHQHVGGIIFLGMGTPQGQIERTQHYQKLSKLPLLIGQDLEWGLTMRLHDTMRFPRNMTLGALKNEQLIYHMSAEIARQAHQLGVHIVFAPVVDINNNPANPVINDRSFGSDKHAVARKGELFMRGLQDNGIIACAKHFPGHGNTSTDSHDELPELKQTRKELDDVELYPFKHLIAQGVRSIMVAHLALPALQPSHTDTTPTSLSHAVVTDLLQHELAFNGLVVTDGLGMGALMNHYAPDEIALQAAQAGNDMLVCPVDVPQSHARIKQAVLDGTIAEQTLDNHVLKILRAKEWALRNAAHAGYDYNTFHTANAYALKKQLYQQAITLVRDDSQLLPLTQDKAHECAILQIGATPQATFITTMQQSCNAAYAHLPAQPTDDACAALHKQFASNSTVIIPIFGMNKFAHKNFGIADTTQRLIQQLHNDGKKIMLVLFGSPYSLELFKNIPSIIVAYEDDPDAQEAAAHVVLGNVSAQESLPV